MRRKGAPPDTIFAAVSLGYTGRTFRRLLAEGKDPNAPGPGGVRPLHVAAASGNTALCSLLLRHGADPTLPDAEGRKPSSVAANGDIVLAFERYAENARARLATEIYADLASLPDEELRRALPALRQGWRQLFGGVSHGE